MIFLTVVLLAILSLGAVSAQEANDSLQLDSSDNFILNDDSTTPVMIQDQVVKIARMLQ